MPNQKQKTWLHAFLICLLSLFIVFSSTIINKSTLLAAGTDTESDTLKQTIPATSTSVIEEELSPTSTAVTPRRTATRTPRATRVATSTARPTRTPRSTVPSVATAITVATATYTPPPTATSAPTSTATRRQSVGATASIYIDSLRLRSAPNESSAVVGGVVQGQSYRVLNISEDGIWIRLAVDNLPGGWGWVPARYTSVKGDITGIAISNDTSGDPAADSASDVSSRQIAEPGDAVVSTNGSRLRVRSEPDGEAEIISHVYDGDAHRVLERSASGRWVRLELDDEPEGGWVSVSYVKLGSDVPAPGQVAQARAVPALAAPTATWTPRSATPQASTPQASTPQAITPTSTTTGQAIANPTPTWTPIPTRTPTTENSTVENSTSENTTSENAIGVAIVRTTGGSRLRVREEPNTTALILGYAYSDNSYSILDRNADGSWVEVSVPGLTEPGWVSTNYLDITYR